MTNDPHAAATWTRGRSRWICVGMYALAAAAALAAGYACRGNHPLMVALVADLAATLVIFAGSFALGNSSLYDPYWSAAPFPIALYFALGSDADPVAARQIAVLVLVALWGLRLTGNWLRGWTGLDHEDWRYVDLAESSGRWYWAVSFSGIHLFPTLVVFAGLLPLYPALATGERAWNALDGIALVVTGGGILLETVADQQLRRFVLAGKARGATLQTGLWAWSRHPNYLGENLFWWGLFLFGLAADPAAWWTGIGAVAITVMFFTASIPMIDRRMHERRPDYAAYAQRVPVLVPRPWRR